MKKSILVLFVFASFATYAQRFSFGVKAGVNLTDVFFDYPMEHFPLTYRYFSKTGFQIGGFTEMKLSEKFSLQGELLYLNRNYDYDFYYPFIDENSGLIQFDALKDLNTKSSALSIPVIIKYYFIDKVALQFGPQFDYTFKSKGTGETFAGDAPHSGNFDRGDFIKADFSENPNLFTWGMDVGIGYDLTEKMNLEFRYNHGFNYNHDSYDTTQRISTFQLNFSYKF